MVRLAMSTIRAKMQLRIARVVLADAAPRNFAAQLVLFSPGLLDPVS